MRVLFLNLLDHPDVLFDWLPCVQLIHANRDHLKESNDFTFIVEHPLFLKQWQHLSQLKILREHTKMARYALIGREHTEHVHLVFIDRSHLLKRELDKFVLLVQGSTRKVHKVSLNVSCWIVLRVYTSYQMAQRSLLLIVFLKHSDALWDVNDCIWAILKDHAI